MDAFCCAVLCCIVLCYAVLCCALERRTGVKSNDVLEERKNDDLKVLAARKKEMMMKITKRYEHPEL